MSILQGDSNFPMSKLVKSKLVYLLGAQTSLLSVKLARNMPKDSTLVTVMSDALPVDSHILLLDLMNIHNNIVCTRDIDPKYIAALLGAPEIADIIVVQSDIVIKLLIHSLSSAAIKLIGEPSAATCGLDLFEELLATIMSIGQTSYLEVPTITAIHDLVEVLSPSCTTLAYTHFVSLDSILQRAIQNHNKLKKVGGGNVAIRRLTGSSTASTKSLHIFEIITTSPSVPNINTGNGVSIYTLLHMGVVPKFKRQLLRMYMEIPFWYYGTDSILPWTVFVLQRHGNFMLDIHRETSNDIATVGISVSDTSSPQSERRRAKFLFKVMYNELKQHQSELSGGKFSFVEHNSGYGYLSSTLAREYPNATIISIEKDLMKAGHHITLINSLGLLNNAVCVKTYDDSIITKNV